MLAFPESGRFGVCSKSRALLGLVPLVSVMPPCLYLVILTQDHWGRWYLSKACSLELPPSPTVALPGRPQWDQATGHKSH